MLYADASLMLYIIICDDTFGNMVEQIFDMFRVWIKDENLKAYSYLLCFKIEDVSELMINLHEY